MDGSASGHAAAVYTRTSGCGEKLDTVPENKAFNEISLFGNQNTVCQPTTPKWRHTVEHLKTYFKKWE